MRRGGEVKTVLLQGAINFTEPPELQKNPRRLLVKF
jgi:hypothetical protein